MGNRTIHRCNLTIIASVPDINPRRHRKRPDHHTTRADGGTTFFVGLIMHVVMLICKTD
jgi:hypothetical protein